MIALGQLGWALRRIEKETGIRRETAAGYLKAAGIPVRPAGGRGKHKLPPAKPANEVTTGSEAAKPANVAEVTTGSGARLWLKASVTFSVTFFLDSRAKGRSGESCMLLI